LPLVNGGTIAVDRRPNRPASLSIENRAGRVIGTAVLPVHDIASLASALLTVSQS
jgi:hypothetical protein